MAKIVKTQRAKLTVIQSKQFKAHVKKVNDGWTAYEKAVKGFDAFVKKLNVKTKFI